MVRASTTTSSALLALLCALAAAQDASYPACLPAALDPIKTDPNNAACAIASEYTFPDPDKKPTGDQMNDMCKSSACKALVESALGRYPAECRITVNPGSLLLRKDVLERVAKKCDWTIPTLAPTPPPTTPAPTTVDPTTPTVTTPAPTTVDPTTPTVTTPAPTTVAPVTPVPTTPCPVTSKPDTSAPTNQKPPTPVPTAQTPAPTTPAPTTTAPTNQKPPTPVSTEQKPPTGQTPVPTDQKPPTGQTPAPTDQKPPTGQTPVPTTKTPVPTGQTPTPTTAAPASGGPCGNEKSGVLACPPGEYCQPWNPYFYQCRHIDTNKCGIQQVGVDFYGDDIASLSLLLPEQCCDKCRATPGCKAYTFVNYNADGKAMCYLKKGTGDKRGNARAVSGVVQVPVACPVPSGGQCGSDKAGVSCCPSGEYCQPWNPFYYQCRPSPAKCAPQQTGVDFYGDDIKRIEGIFAWDCCDQCAATKGCKAYTFINFNPNGKSACYLKSGMGQTQAKVGAVSSTLLM